MPLTAKFPSTCARCGSAVTPGEQITDAGGQGRKRWQHVTCPQGSLDLGSAGQAALPVPEDETATRVWTDGACSGNPGPGGWAWATRDGRQGSGGAARTTNQRMEIQAAYEAVKTLTDSPLVVVSDSTYVVNCFRDGWWKGWLARGWVNSAKKPVANRDLWEPFVELVRDRGDVTFRWVKGHSGDEMNDRVDALAVAAGKAVAG